MCVQVRVLGDLRGLTKCALSAAHLLVLTPAVLQRNGINTTLAQRCQRHHTAALPSVERSRRQRREV